MYESEEVAVFQVTVNAVVLTLDVATEEIPTAAEVVNASVNPVPVVEVAVEVLYDESPALTQK